MAVILDTALIIRRRTELGITARALARFLNVTLAVVRLLELGSNHDEISLALVVRARRSERTRPAPPRRRASRPIRRRLLRR